MDWEAPVDAWYVFLAVSIVSVAVAGVVFGLPTGPPPDSNQAANAIESVASSPTEASATWAYEAETVVIDGPTIEMENEHGTSHASAEYDAVVVPVNDSDRLENIARGAAFEAEYADELDDEDTHAVQAFLGELETAYEKNSGEPMTASGELVVRQVSVDPDGDEVENEYESATLEVTETSRFDNVREVTLSYDGVSGRTVELNLDGTYTTGSDLSYSEDRSFRFGDGSIVVSDISSPDVGFAGDPPLSYTVDFDGIAGADITWSGTDLGVDGTVTWDNEIERSAEFDDSAPFVEHREDTDRYHVTLVIV
ncbi:DUF7283 family protein [Haloterrigena alkaliphila]|uniref:Uncharacterized protein n=1 Tax=Haloterrigena alkaliphila TaxID=2816475 RepID=A0A8A2VCY3_9EURY|nr:hypothetical protein [Haloterrigena alkaliphila]QSW99371.1 hypothetical protein J0X25_18700 [Haloterrigena alkaliphila]